MADGMNRLDIFKPQVYIAFLLRVGWPLIALYVFSMFVFPWFQGSFEWNSVQNVWDRWQGLNVGMLAFAASLIAFDISLYKAERERKRNFISERAFLPEALSELTTYCRASMALFAEAWTRVSEQAVRQQTSLETPVPDLPENYRVVFQECIKTAEPKVGDALAYILMRLQIHHSRMRGLAEEISPDNRMIINAGNLISYLYRIAEIQALINQLFEYARGIEDFDGSPLEWENYRNALSLAGISINEYEDLQGFIERTIAQGDEIS